MKHAKYPENKAFSRAQRGTLQREKETSLFSARQMSVLSWPARDTSHWPKLIGGFSISRGTGADKASMSAGKCGAFFGNRMRIIILIISACNIP